VVAAAALLLSATSLAAAGSLDRSFSDNDRLTIKAAKDAVGSQLEVTSRTSTFPASPSFQAAS